MTLPHSPRLIVIDDHKEWCIMLEKSASLIGYRLDIAYSFEQAQLDLAAAEEQQITYLAAIIDMKFAISGTEVEYFRGKEVVQFIKAKYPKVACIMVSGVATTPGQILDMRDEYDLDYFVEKSRFDIDTFSDALNKALRRVAQHLATQTPEHELQNTLLAWERAHLTMSQSLAILEEREAKLGMTSDVKTIHELHHYRTRMQEAEAKIADLKTKLAALKK
jgi:ActR/RegA family two-component response regulator